MNSADDILLALGDKRSKQVARRASLPARLDPRRILFGLEAKPKTLRQKTKQTKKSPKASPKLRGTKKDNKGFRDNVFRLSKLTKQGISMAKKCADYSLAELKDILEKLSGKRVTYTKRIDYCNSIERQMIEKGLMSPGASPKTSPKTSPKAPTKASPPKKISPKLVSIIAPPVVISPQPKSSPKGAVTGTFRNKTGASDDVFRIVRGPGTGRDCKAFSIPELKEILFQITGREVTYKLKVQYCKEIEEALRGRGSVQL